MKVFLRLIGFFQLFPFLEGSYEEHVYSPHIRYEMPTHSSTIIVANQSPAFMQPLRHRPYCPLEFWNISERAATELVNTNSAMEMAQFQIRVFLIIFKEGGKGGGSTFV